MDTDSVFYQAAFISKVRNPEIDENSDEQMIPILSVAQEVEGHINKVYDTNIKMFNIHSHRFDIKQETIFQRWILGIKEKILTMDYQ